MKTLLFAAAVASLLTISCAPSDQTPPSAQATPAASAGDEITEIDFESGEVDQSTTEIEEEPAGEPTPEVP